MDPRFPQELGTVRGVSIVFLMLIVIETLVMHLLLSTWSPILDKILLVLSAVSVLYIIFDVIRISSSSITLLGDELVIQNGLRGFAKIPRTLVRKASLGEINLQQKGDFSLAPARRSTVILELHTPTKISGPLGVTLQVRRIGVSPIDAKGFLLQLDA